MVRVDSPPRQAAHQARQTHQRKSPFVRPVALAVVLTAAATAAAAVAVGEGARIPVVWAGAVATVLVAVLTAEIVRRGRLLTRARAEHAQRTASLERRLAEHDDETVRLAKELMPAAIRRLRSGESPAEVIRDVVDADERYRDLPYAQRDLLRTVLDIIDLEEARRESAQRAFVNIARRVQAIVHQQASELRQMEEDHGRNPEVFDDLLRIDHGTALIGRLADSISVLGGARPSRQWPRAVPLFSVLRGAMSRILEYRRVDLHSIAKVAIIGTAVEPLIHACAELLDNATRYSPPQTRVHVTAVEVQTGIAIEIEDGGVSLSEEARGRAENMLAQAQAGIDLNALGDTPRLGMAVVGRLSQMYNLQVSLRQSAYGGVRAVLIVPRDIVTTGPAPGIAHGIGASAVPRGTQSLGMSPEEARVPQRKPRPAAPKPPVPHVPHVPTPTPAPGPVSVPRSAMEEDVPVVTEWTENGLPQRRSRGRAPLGSHNLPAQERQAAAEAAAAAAAEAAAAGQPVKEEPEPGIWLEAFTKAANGVPLDPPAEADGPPSQRADRSGDDTWDKGDLK